MANDVDIMARTIWGEARNQGVEGMTAVACVIMNRARHPRWWGNSPAGVCEDKEQFSCWNPGDPNRPKLIAVTAADPQFAQAMEIAHRAVLGMIDDVTGNADSYYAIATRKPYWAIASEYTVTIGGQAFYRTELPAELR
jgi:N-acetylmuramoyl-L-alanine amidase